MPDNSEAKAPPPRPSDALGPAAPPTLAPSASEGGCDRCGAQMFRMHAVWRCLRCGYKTDCCGW